MSVPMTWRTRMCLVCGPRDLRRSDEVGWRRVDELIGHLRVAGERRDQAPEVEEAGHFVSPVGRDRST